MHATNKQISVIIRIMVVVMAPNIECLPTGHCSEGSTCSNSFDLPNNLMK